MAHALGETAPLLLIGMISFVPGVPMAIDQPAYRAELMWRLSVPISAVVLALLAIPLSFVNPRAGRSANLLLALFTYLLYNNLMTISQAWIAGGRTSFAVGLFGVHLIMLAVLPFMFYRRIAIFSLGRWFR